MPSKDKYEDPRPDLAVVIDDDEGARSADILGDTQKTVVFKNADGLYSYAHLHSEGYPWIHASDEPCKSKDDAKTAAQLAYPAWPVEHVDEDPWVAQAEAALEEDAE